MAPLGKMAALLALVLALAALAPAAAQITNTRLFVNTALGRIRGAACPGNSNTFRWLGIPYAQAPTGNLRWAPPVAYNTAYPSPQFDAGRAGPYCPQDAARGLGASAATGFSEDCLSINVWAPLNISVRQPVRVFIHGGGLSSSSGGWAAYDGCQVSADANVLTVTFNYRLGVLGWLGAPGLGSGSGNFGLLDSQLALQWVQTNIGAFGGDPARVTIHAASSGAILALANLVSPAAYNSDFTPRLFSALVLESPALYTYNTVNDTYAMATEFSTYVNCTSGNLTCLRALSADSIISGQRRMTMQDFGPTIDGTILPSAPFALLDLGRSPRVPLFLTTSADEANLAVIAALPAGANDLTQTAAQNLIISQTNPPPQFRQRILNTYNAQAFGGSWFTAASTAITDARYSSGSVRLMDAISALGSNVYAGLYVMPNTNGCPYRMLGLTPAQVTAFRPRLGAIHGADVATYFQHSLVGTGAPAFPWNCTASDYTAEERQLATFVGGAVASFLDRRNPVPITTRSTTSPALQAVRSWPRWNGLFGTASGPSIFVLDLASPAPVNESLAARARHQVWDDVRDYMDTNGRYGAYPSVQAYILSRPSDLSLIAALLQASGDWPSLLSGSATYFLPNNNAVNAYINASNTTAAAVLALPQAQLQALMRYHVYPALFDVVKGMPPRQRVVMASGRPAYFMRTDTTVRVLDANLYGALVNPAAASVVAGRSYVNIIDRVLNPQCS